MSAFVDQGEDGARRSTLVATQRNTHDRVTQLRAEVTREFALEPELVGMGVQNLRAYEARGLLEPDRSAGGTRRYSADDLDRLRRIGDLLEAGLNLAGVAMVLALQDENAQLRTEKEQQ
jgi:MerR family transcriptional regulator, heat shock protein HspR